MRSVGSKLRAGDWVEVKGPLEIARTLDADGLLDGLPFMPEMMEFCGKRFRVLRRVEKTCVEFPGPVYEIREFHNNDVVLLEIPRCSGDSHGGCQRSCVIFWKQGWLRKTSKDQPTAPARPLAPEELQARLKTIQAPGRYLCQSTALANATHALNRPRVVLKCFLDVLSGSRGVFEMTKYVVIPVFRYVRAKFPRKRLLVGNLKRTPVGNLELQPGEWVRIKSETEIAATLDSRACNRGLPCDGGMRQFCGGRYQVRSRLERMISETTGEMRQVGSTVILDGLNCLCWQNHVGGCPRDDFMWWREIWLEREQEPGRSIEAGRREVSDCDSQARRLSRSAGT